LPWDRWVLRDGLCLRLRPPQHERRV